MIRGIAGPALAFATAAALFGQPAPLSFEVASLKPAAPITDGKIMVRMGGDPGRLDWTNVSLKDILRQAYEVKEYQISGPDWMGSARFDLSAKLPEGAPRSKVPEMLQSLLAERFKVTVHKETKELPMYGLVVSKGGVKMKESEIDPNAPPPGSGPGPGGPGPEGGVRFNRDGKPVFVGNPRGPMMMMNSTGHLSAKMMNMAGLVNFLARQVDRPVIDETGLTKSYDFDLDFVPENMQGMMGHMPPPPGGGEGGPTSSANNSENNGVSIFNAVQSQLGLKLEAKKGSVELIVVDHVEKTPTEN